MSEWAGHRLGPSGRDREGTWSGCGVPGPPVGWAESGVGADVVRVWVASRRRGRRQGVGCGCSTDRPQAGDG